MLYLSRDDVFTLLTPAECVAACEEALNLEARGEAEQVPRFHFDLAREHATGPNWLRFMPSMVKSKGVIGLRVYGGNPLRLMYIVWNAHDGTPLVMMEAQAIRDVRTGAVGAVGSKYLARADSRRVGVLGSGNQARTGLASHAAIFDLAEVKVYSPNKQHREEFARGVGGSLRLRTQAVDSAEAAVADVDIVITGSNRNASTREPTYRGRWLTPGIFVCSIGGKCELDDEAVTRADKVVIDSKVQFPYEARDVTDQVNNGHLSWGQIPELHEIVSGQKPGRSSAQERILLKTVGTPLQDLLPAARVYELALERGVGRDLGDLFPPVQARYLRSNA